MTLYIKNMVCHRCKMVVKAELEKLHLLPVSVSLGEVILEENSLSLTQIDAIKNALSQSGFEWTDDKRSKLITQIKSFVIDMIHYNEEQPLQKYSEIIARQLHHDYSYLSNLFSTIEGITIEQYIIQQKVEKAKELMLYDEKSLSQIAFQLGYSSTAHLSTQFKKVTSLTPSQFRQLGFTNRKSLDEVGIKK